MTIVTARAPSSNQQGETEANHVTLNMMMVQDEPHVVISSVGLRNAWRETFAKCYPQFPHNRSRVLEAEQLTVRYADLPNAEVYVDDFFWGFLVTDPKVTKNAKQPTKRASIIQVNIAVSLEPFRFETQMTQAPRIQGEHEGGTWANSQTSALLNRDVVDTAFQFPLTLPIGDCLAHPQGIPWTQGLIRSLQELSNVGGNQARSYFDMSPRSFAARVTSKLAPNWDTYGFRSDGTFVDLPRVGKGIPAREIWLAGEIVRNMTPKERLDLKELGAHLYDETEEALDVLATTVTG